MKREMFCEVIIDSCIKLDEVRNVFLFPQMIILSIFLAQRNFAVSGVGNIAYKYPTNTAGFTPPQQAT